MKKLFIYIWFITFWFLINLFLIWIIYSNDEKRKCMFNYLEEMEYWTIYFDNKYDLYHIDERWLENLDRYEKINNMNWCYPEDVNIVSIVNFFYCYMVKFIKKTWIQE